MYPKVKRITDEQYEEMRQAEIKALSERKYRIPPKIRSNYYSNNRKEIQRVLNYYVKLVNHAIENDYLWRGRFFIRQVGPTYFERFEDGSGADLSVSLRFYDKKTERYIDTFGTVSTFCFGGGSKLSWLMNDAIVKEFKVWEYDKKSEDNPYNDRIVYSSIPDEYTIQRARPLYDSGRMLHA